MCRAKGPAKATCFLSCSLLTALSRWLLSVCLPLAGCCSGAGVGRALDDHLLPPKALFSPFSL